MIEKFKLDNLVSNKKPQDTVVVVAMSGGVDSSTVAALLHKLQYQVIGITMQLYNGNNSLKKNSCCGSRDIIDAKRVAADMGFPHYVLDYEETFAKEVIQDFAESYISGKTPIPCVKCNQTVKFRDLLKVAKNLNADVLVTGHYVRRYENKGEIQIFSSQDVTKDQSYFLFATTIEQLKFLRFPLGDFCKEDIRLLALSLGLKIFDKPDSQDICFVADKYYKTILDIKPDALSLGDIVHVNGKVLGKHNGIINFTVGQRKGLGISYSEPLYVVSLNAERNEVIVGPYSALLKDNLIIKDCNWLSKDSIPSSGLEVKVKLRSSHTGSAATIYPPNSQNEILVSLKNKHFAITPGQACVIYDNNRLLGGGWIMK